MIEQLHCPNCNTDFRHDIPDVVDSTDVTCPVCSSAVHFVRQTAETAELAENPASKPRRRTIGLAITGMAIVIVVFAFLQSCLQNRNTTLETPSAIVEHLVESGADQDVAIPVLEGESPDLWLDQYPGTVYTINEAIHLSFFEDPKSDKLVLIRLEGVGFDFADNDAYTLGFYIAELLQLYTDDDEELELVYSEIGLDNPNFFTPAAEIYQTDTAAFVHIMEDGYFTFAIDFIY